MLKNILTYDISGLLNKVLSCKPKPMIKHLPLIFGGMLLLALCMSSLIFPNPGVLADVDGDFIYTLSGVDAIITGYTGPSGSVNIPDMVGPSDEYPVIAIGNSALSNKGLTSVTIPNSVIDIGNYAFSNNGGLISVIVPNNVASIGTGAFAGCAGLTSMTIGSSVESIGGSAFYHTGLTAFIVDGSNTHYSIDAYGVLFNFDQTFLITYPPARSGSYTIPDGVTNIVNSAFYACTGLTSITIPDSVTSIGNYAFYACTGLTSIDIPDSVTSIGTGAFSSCTGLTSIDIPDGVTSIGDQTFYGCTGLTSINIPDSVTSIGTSTFAGCTGLTDITLPDNLTSIGNYAFNNCDGLTSITIPDSVISIGDHAFYDCTNLIAAYFLGNAPAIGADAFANCAPDFTVYYLEGKTGWDDPSWDQYALLSINQINPSLDSVNIISDNTNHFYAMVGDSITLTFVADRKLQTPTVTIESGGFAVLDSPPVISNPSGNNWVATYMVDQADVNGAVTFSIDYMDLAGKQGIQVTTTTDASSVTKVTSLPNGIPPPTYSPEEKGENIVEDMEQETPEVPTGENGNNGGNTGNININQEIEYGYYTVQPGDSMRMIAGKVYGDAERWQELVDLNRDEFPLLQYDANILYSEWVLRYIKQGSIISEVSAPVVPAIPNYRYYRVQPGDDLVWIAQKLYGDKGMWLSVWELNRDVLIYGPETLYSDWVLKYKIN